MSPQIPYFGRAWSIQLKTKDGSNVELSSNDSAQPLRAIFDIQMRAMLAYWTCEVTIYNVNSAVAKQVSATAVPVDQLWHFLQPVIMGDNISISAGYKYGTDGSAFDPAANLIFQGNVFQPMWTRENVVDWKITVRCVVGYQQDSLNHVNFSMGKGQSPVDVLNGISRDAKIPIEHIDDISQQVLSQKKFPRGQTIFGRPYSVLRDMAKENNLQMWVSPNGINVRSLNFDANTTPDITYAPPNLISKAISQSTGPVKYTLIGVPEQTQDGILFRVLMDAEVKIGSIVKVAPGTAINPFPTTIGQLPAVPNPSGLYVVAGIRRFGDTMGRAADWYTEITAMTANFFPEFLLNKAGGN